MENSNKNIDKVKSVVEEVSQKSKDSEVVNKVKNTAIDMTQKIKENETIAGAVDKINQNEYVAKVNKSKYAKLIKIGAVVIGLIIVFNVFSFIFSDKDAKKAQDNLVSELTTALQSENCTNIKIDSKAIGKNEDAALYAFDTTVKYKYDSQNQEYSAFYIVYYDKETNDSFITREFEYDNKTKKDMKDIALGVLARG